MITGRVLQLCAAGLLLGFILGACGSTTTEVIETPMATIACEGVSIGNPAAAYCSLLGYQNSVQDTPEGQAGMCNLPDGTSCEAWDFLRGKCGMSFSWCAINGMEIQTITESDGVSTQEYAVCVDSNGVVAGTVFDLSGLQTLLDACNRQ